MVHQPKGLKDIRKAKEEEKYRQELEQRLKREDADNLIISLTSSSPRCFKGIIGPCCFNTFIQMASKTKDQNSLF